MNEQQMRILTGLIGITAGLNKLLVGIHDAYSDGNITNAEATGIILKHLESGINEAAKKNKGV